MTTILHPPLPVRRLAASSRRRVAVSAFWLLASGFWLLFLTGCFSEHSYPMRPDRIAHFSPQQLSPDSQPLTTRAWARASALAAPLLPADAPSPITSDAFLASSGQPIDIFHHFHFDPGEADNLFGNYDGILETAQVAGPDRELDKQGHLIRPSWPGFSDIEVPVEPLDSGPNPLKLYARISNPDPDDNHTFIIITHGLFGSIDGADMQNQVNALRFAHFPVLALEMRGHGETQCRHPEATFSFGIYECGDLLAAARWLKDTHHARRVGLVSFSLAGYEALLTAWLDGQQPVTRFKKFPPLAGLPTPQPEPAFNAGMMVISAPVDLLQTANRFEIHHSLFDAPVESTFEQHIADHCVTCKAPPTFSMWGLAKTEYYRAGWGKKYGPYEKIEPEILRFLDFSGASDAANPRWSEGARRMENVRVPLLILHSANDPLATAQGVVNLLAHVKNPNIGCIILDKGGHMAFPAYASDYYYSVLLNFFNPATCPTAENPAPLAIAP